jgi:CrcB protein
MTVLLVAVGAAVGAPLRYLVDRALNGRHGSRLPWGTLAVNVAGSFLLGMLAAGSLRTPAPVMAAVGTGFCGTLTTYSTFGYETVRLWHERAGRYAVGWYAVGNVAVSVGSGLGAAVLGAAVAQAVLP